MMRNLFKDYIYPVATLAGSIIGVGIFSLPYVAVQSGIWVTLFYFAGAVALMVLVHLIFTEISLKTPDFKRFPGFVKYHLGKNAGFFALILYIFGTFGVLLAYLLIGSQFLSGILSPYMGDSDLLYLLLFFIAVTIVIFMGIKAISKIELVTLSLLFLSFILIFIGGFLHFKFSNIFISNSKLQILNYFLPYGPLIFALWGTGLIPEVEEMIQKKKNIKKIVLISTLIPAVIYLLFIFLIVGMTGKNVSQNALDGLKNFLPTPIFLIALFSGVITTFTAFITQGITLKKVLVYDMGIKDYHALIITCFVPLTLLLLGLNSFIPIMSFIGGVILGLDGVLILLMYKKIGGKNIIIYPLSLIFILGVIYQICFFKF